MSTIGSASHIEKLDEIHRLRDINAKLLSALREVEEFLEERADAEYFTDSAAPVPNDEMKLLVVVRAALPKAGKP